MRDGAGTAEYRSESHNVEQRATVRTRSRQLCCSGNLPAQLQFLVLQDNEITDIGANWIAKVPAYCCRLCS